MTLFPAIVIVTMPRRGMLNTDPFVICTAKCGNPARFYQVTKAGFIDYTDVLVFIDHPYCHYNASIVMIVENRAEQHPSSDG